jgi:uncharacterized integral membrane protein
MSDRPDDTTASDAARDTGDSTAAETPRPGKDPLRGSATSRTWVVMVLLALVLVALVVFVAQNTQDVGVRFLGWTWHLPLAVEILGSVATGLVLAVCAGTLRILQLRRRVRRDNRRR